MMPFDNVVALKSAVEVTKAEFPVRLGISTSDFKSYFKSSDKIIVAMYCTSIDEHKPMIKRVAVFNSSYPGRGSLS